MHGSDLDGLLNNLNALMSCPQASSGQGPPSSATIVGEIEELSRPFARSTSVRTFTPSLLLSTASDRKASDRHSVY